MKFKWKRVCRLDYALNRCRYVRNHLQEKDGAQSSGESEITIGAALVQGIDDWRLFVPG